MGCVSSKRVIKSPPTPRSRSSTVTVRRNVSSVRSEPFGPVFERGPSKKLERIREEPDKENGDGDEDEEVVEEPGGSTNGVLEGLPKQASIKKGGSGKKAATFTFRFGRYSDADPIAAGWPPWLSSVAAEAVEGWLPLRPDLFEKLEKIGQGTYSSVYRARNVETGRIFALKKVRFDTFQPESVRFMAREIAILRRLDHPNIMKLEGLIANRLSCSIYLVFEYMEHDLAGLLSCPSINFSDAQIKCYMRQLLAGLEHCHSRGVMHRDIKTSNILVNNEGNLKIADFGLANYISLRHRQSLTSRVVTLWYRPPELLMGSTNYGPSVDMWSVGCVFAELFVGKPILKGRTEVEQLHRIFKLCGSPPDEYWRKYKLPLSTMFRPQHPYPSSLREMFNEFPKSALRLLETFLAMEPHKRGTASSALDSEYFSTKPYACNPSSLPSYPPNKEIDAKLREDLRRRKAGIRSRPSGTSRNPVRTRNGIQASSCRVVPSEETESAGQCSRGCNGTGTYTLKARGATESREVLKSSVSTVSEASQATDVSRVTSVRSVPAISASSGFAWSKKRKGNAIPPRLYSQANPRNQDSSSLDPSSVLHPHTTLEAVLEQESENLPEPYDSKEDSMRRRRDQPCRLDSSSASDAYRFQEFSVVK